MKASNSLFTVDKICFQVKNDFCFVLFVLFILSSTQKKITKTHENLICYLKDASNLV